MSVLSIQPTLPPILVLQDIIVQMAPSLTRSIHVPLAIITRTLAKRALMIVSLVLLVNIVPALDCHQHLDYVMPDFTVC